MLQRVWRMIGRRGLTLIFVGVLDFVFAVNLLIIQNPNAVRVYGSILPLDWWAWIWIFAGVAAWGSAPLKKDRIGFAISSVIFSFWGWLSFLAWLRGEQPTGWATAGFFLVITALIMIPSTWPETISLPKAVIGDDFPSAVITADDHGIITNWLGRAEQMFGWTAEEVTGRAITMIMPIKYHTAHENGIVKVRETGRSEMAGKILRAEGLNKDGTEFPVNVLIGVHHTEAGIVFTTTITDLRGRV